MDIKKMLEYQSIDVKRKEEIRRFNKLKVVEDINKAHAIITKAKQALDKLNKEIEDLVSQLNSISSRYKDQFDLLKDTEANLYHIADENEADFYIKTINGYIQTIETLAQEAKRLSEKISNNKTNRDNCMATGKKANTEFLKLKEEYDQEAKKTKEIRGEFEEKLAKIGLSNEDLEIYKQVAGENKYPVLHVLRDNYCFCRIEMPGSVTQKVKASGWCICPDCGRILISEDAYEKAKA